MGHCWVLGVLHDTVGFYKFHRVLKGNAGTAGYWYHKVLGGTSRNCGDS